MHVKLHELEDVISNYLLAPSPGRGVVLPAPAPVCLSEALRSELRKGEVNHPLKALAFASGLLAHAARLMDCLRDPLAEQDRLTVGAIGRLWEDIHVGRLLLELWEHDIVVARELSPYQCPLGVFPSATHAVQALAETVLAEVWRVAQDDTPEPPYRTNDEPFEPQDSLPPLRLDWWYSALPALRRHYHGSEDRWGLDGEATHWEAGLQAEIAILRSWRPVEAPGATARTGGSLDEVHPHSGSHCVLLPFTYDYVSTEDAIRVARQGALDILRRLERLWHAVSRPDPTDWYAEAARWLADDAARKETRWSAAIQTAGFAQQLPAATVVAPAARAVERLGTDISLVCHNALPCIGILARALLDALRQAPPANLSLFYLEDWPRLLSIDPGDRWCVTREGRITPTVRSLRADPQFRLARQGMLRAVCRWMPSGDPAGLVSPVRYRSARDGCYSDEANIAIQELRGALAAHDLDALRAPFEQTTDGADYSELNEFAASTLKGIERTTLELICTNGGEYPLADLAADPAVQWNRPWDDSFNSARKRINVKLKEAGLGWKLERHDNKAKLKKVATKNRTKKS
jgi:hypothetical protein